MQTNTNLEKFSSQVNADVLAALRADAKKKGVKLQYVLERAAREYLEREDTSKPRAWVLEIAEQSMIEHRELYELLAK